MNTKEISDVEAFKRESEKARNIKPSQDEIDHINNLIRDAEIEESENENSKIPAVAKDSSDEVATHI